jgi:hypothetical protein
MYEGDMVTENYPCKDISIELFLAKPPSQSMYRKAIVIGRSGKEMV